MFILIKNTFPAWLILLIFVYGVLYTVHLTEIQKKCTYPMNSICSLYFKAKTELVYLILLN